MWLKESQGFKRLEALSGAQVIQGFGLKKKVICAGAFREDIWGVFDRNLCGSALRNISDIRAIHLHIIVTIVVREKDLKARLKY